MRHQSAYDRSASGTREPSTAPTVIVTLLFGLFGLIPAAVGASRSARPGRYWRAFGVSLAGSAAVWTATVAAVVLLVVAPQSRAASVRAGTCSDGSGTLNFLSELVPCEQPHRQEAVLVGPAGTVGTEECDAAEQVARESGAFGTGNAILDLPDGRSACVVLAQLVGSVAAGTARSIS